MGCRQRVAGLRIRVAVVALVFAASTGGALAQSTVRWVDRTKTDVRTGRGSFYEIVDTLIKGDKVEVLRTEGRWVFVSTPRAKQGWVFEPALSATTVAPGDADFLKVAPDDASTSRPDVSAGAKSMYPRAYAQQKGYDYSVVTWVEQTQPNSAEFEQFVKDGGLTPAGGRE